MLAGSFDCLQAAAAAAEASLESEQQEAETEGKEASEKQTGKTRSRPSKRQELARNIVSRSPPTKTRAK